jgi:hypothetical protein
MTDAEVRIIPLRRALDQPLEATRAFADRLAMTRWTPMTWRLDSIPIWGSLPVLRADLDRIMAALRLERGRCATPDPVDRAREACHQASEEVNLLMDRIDNAWMGRWQAPIGGPDQLRALPSITHACDRLQLTLDRLSECVNAIPQTSLTR